MKKIFIYLAISLVILPWVTRAIASDVSIQGDRLTLRADQVPLQSILQRLTDLGIKVHIDPQINPKITASFQDRDIRQGLGSILKPFGHVLIWKTIEGPAGSMPKLAEIHVFKHGKKGLRPIYRGIGFCCNFTIASQGFCFTKGGFTGRMKKLRYCDGAIPIKLTFFDIKYFAAEIDSPGLFLK